MIVLSQRRFTSTNHTTPPECTKCDKNVLSVIAIPFALFIGVAAIRYYTEVTSDQYIWPCNNTDIIPPSEIKILEKEKTAYQKIINEYEKSTLKNQLSAEVRNIKNDIEKKIKAQNCFQQSCAKINIQNNLEKIKNKILLISTWLFRTGAVLLLLCGIWCYYDRTLLGWGFGIFVFIFIGPIFINAFLSLYDFHCMSNFRMKC